MNGPRLSSAHMPPSTKLWPRPSLSTRLLIRTISGQFWKARSSTKPYHETGQNNSLDELCVKTSHVCDDLK